MLKGTLWCEIEGGGNIDCEVAEVIELLET